MPTKSYSLADGTTVTVNATDNGIKFNEGMQALTKAIKAKIANSTKPTPNLSIGGWSAVDTVYTVPITYDGDGALSVNVGSISNGSLIVADEDGIFSGVLSATAGDSFAPAKLYFNFDTDTVTVQGGGGSSSIPDSIVTALGSQFVPTVDNATDFISYADGNIQFFDNRLNQFFNAKNDYLVLLDDGVSDTPTVKTSPEQTNQATFLWGTVTVSTGFDSSSNLHYLASSANTVKVGCGTENSTLEYDTYLFKLSETAAFVYRPSRRKNGSYVYQGYRDYIPCSISSDGSIATQSVFNLWNTLSSVASAEHKGTLQLNKSCLSQRDFTVAMVNKSKTNLWPSTYRTYNIDCDTGAIATLTVGNKLSTIWSNPNGKENLDYCAFVSEYPAVVQFDGQDVTVSKGSTPTSSPFLYYKVRTRNSSGSITGGGDYIGINSGLNRAGEPKTLQLITVASGVESTLNTWLEDDGYFIHGVYPNEERTDCYVVTYKPGTYPKSSWLNDAFTVWNVDFLTPRFVKSDKKLPQVLDDLAI